MVYVFLEVTIGRSVVTYGKRNHGCSIRATVIGFLNLSVILQHLFIPINLPNRRVLFLT
jgi:hypothetical protein